MNCSMLQLVVRSSRGSGCGFVVVAVLFPCLLFCSVLFLSVCNEWTGRLLLTAWTWPMELSSRCAKAGHYVFGHLRCHFISTVMPFELLLYHKLIFAFFGFAVCSSCQNRSLFLCIVSSVNVINSNRHTQDSAKDIHIYSNSFQCFQEKEREAFQSHLPLSLANKRNFLCISLRTS